MSRPTGTKKCPNCGEKALLMQSRCLNCDCRLPDVDVDADPVPETTSDPGDDPLLIPLVSEGKKCPGCERELPAATVLCVACGFDFRMGAKHETVAAPAALPAGLRQVEIGLGFHYVRQWLFLIYFAIMIGGVCCLAIFYWIPTWVSQMISWTFQRANVGEHLRHGKRHVPAWDYISSTDREAYKWMADQLSMKLGCQIDSPPVWSWHSWGDHIAGPTVETATTLLSESELQNEMVVITIDSPSKLALLSSYAIWNEFFVWLNGRSLPSHDKHVEDTWRYMFEAPLIRFPADAVQVVLPYIDPVWVKSICRLDVIGREPNELL